jgi:hypothetical protein
MKINLGYSISLPIKDYIINQPKYNLENLAINETVVNTILPQIKKKFNVQAEEWNPSYMK